MNLAKTKLTLSYIPCYNFHCCLHCMHSELLGCFISIGLVFSFQRGFNYREHEFNNSDMASRRGEVGLGHPRNRDGPGRARAGRKSRSGGPGLKLA